MFLVNFQSTFNFYCDIFANALCFFFAKGYLFSRQKKLYVFVDVFIVYGCDKQHMNMFLWFVLKKESF